VRVRLPWSDDIILGSTAPPLPFPRFRLRPADQKHHATIWGRTGSGKSRLLESVFIQHVAKKHGVGLIEPHHDLSFDTLTYLVSKGFFKHPKAYERLVYVDWGNGAFVPFNILSDDGKMDPHTRALHALDAMIRVWPELTEAPLFQQLFLSSMIALQAAKLPITFLYAILTDLEMRRRCLELVGDPLIHQVFDSFDRLGREQTQAAGSTLRRAFLLSFNPIARLTLGQPENWLPFRRWLDEGTSFIINLGNINDHETRKLIGALLMVSIEQAALSRTDLPPSARKPCTLLVDEWPCFAAQGQTIGTILSQTRKFGLRLYLAGQSLSQVSSDRLTGALENCRLTIVFGLGRDSAEIEAKQIGSADPFAIKEEPLTETQHSQYQSIVDQFESWTQELQNLSPRLGYVKLHDQPAAKIKTLTVPDAKVRADELTRVLATYKQRYQRTREEAEKAIGSLGDTPVATSANTPPAPAYTSLFQRPWTADDHLTVSEGPTPDGKSAVGSVAPGSDQSGAVRQAAGGALINSLSEANRAIVTPSRRASATPVATRRPGALT
jgi:hypothetical protein